MSNHILTQDGKWVTISDDELYHWKYIKREKVNGKWRYFYNNDEYQAYKNAAARESKQSEAVARSEKRQGTLIGSMRDARKKYEEAEAMPGDTLEYIGHDHRGFFYDYTEKGRRMNDAKEQYHVSKEKLPEANKYTQVAKTALAEAKKNTAAAKKKYEESSGYKVADFLNKSSDAVDKAKSWVSNLFKRKKNK